MGADPPAPEQSMGADPPAREHAVGADEVLLTQLRTTLAISGDPERAAGQQAYMKSSLPFHGLTLPQVRELTSTLVRSRPPGDRTTWEATVRALWDGATHREQWYAALAIAEHRAARAWQDRQTLELYRHLAITGAWWDVVDQIAPRLVGPILRADPGQVTPVIRAWAGDPDLWLRRVAILSQLRHRDATDPALLEHCVVSNLEGSLHGHEFFIRKALGWALRQHARTEPQWVLDLLERHQGRVSTLTRQEATKHLRAATTSAPTTTTAGAGSGPRPAPG